MFLGVSDTLDDVDMTDEQRKFIGDRATDIRITRYGTKMAAYQAAGVNSATWDRIEKGEPVREDRLIAVVKTLWPDTGGQWQKVPGIDSTDPRSYPVFGGSYDEPEYLKGIEQWVMELQGRVEAIEEHIAKEQAHGNAAAMTQARGSRAEEDDATQLGRIDYEQGVSGATDVAPGVRPPQGRGAR